MNEEEGIVIRWEDKANSSGASEVQSEPRKAKASLSCNGMNGS